MKDDRLDREMIERAEDLILRLRDIYSCRISTDETGAVSEVHVVATTDRSPKKIARDVETCLKAGINLDVDYRKIGVVIIDPMKETDPAKRQEASSGEADSIGDGDIDRFVEERLTEFTGMAGEFGDDFVAEGGEPAQMPPDAVGRGPLTAGVLPGAGTGWEQIPSGESPSMQEPVAEEKAAKAPERGAYPAGEDPALEFLEQDMRVRFAGLRLSIEETRVDAEVKLEKNGFEVIGCLGGYRTDGPMYETIAGATIHALTELLDERFHLCLSTVKEVEVSGSRALLAVVGVIDGRAVRSYAGCVFVGRDSNEAAVLAVLDALNRPSGRWKSRTEIHYRIR